MKADLEYMENDTPSPRSPSDLPTQWRERAQLLREHGAPDHARLVEHLATELDQVLAAGGDITLNLQEAARESGYSAGHLGALLKRGVIPNAGRPGSPRIRRSDLPHKSDQKPGRPSKKSAANAATIANAFRERKREV